ncbi:nitrate/nitrite transporter NrtS [Sulfurivermis fontis]|jgi:hypothetical protein|uniref:nitrate/nitrite transporter NrtS n=1 Tax=Sulfurivermis fontis TaxID=1972068 RepID=UPI000FD7C968|nr:nitrate/nitrite transporter NrtS [Sulfurivermis fontis]
MPDIVPILRAACAPTIVRGAVRIALVVGLALNLINQGEALLHGADIRWAHALLNFLVPYGVASYSAARHQLSQEAP